MNYIRKKSIALRRRAARRWRTIRNQFRKIDLSLSIELNLLVVKFKLTVKRRD